MQPKVTILIATYLKSNAPYLELAFRSIAMQTYKNIEVVCVFSGHTPDLTSLPFNLPYAAHLSHERLHYPEAIACAYKHVSPNSEFIMLLNDDAFMSADCVENLVAAMGQQELILNPLSQCDNGLFFEGPVGFRRDDQGLAPEGLFMDRQYRYEQIVEQFENIVKYPRPQYIPFKFYTNFSPFYCTLMRKKTWEKVGGIDTAYKTNLDDLSFALEARKYGIRCATEMSAFAFHFSGVSTSPGAEGEVSKQDQEFNFRHFESKHGFRP